MNKNVYLKLDRFRKSISRNKVKILYFLFLFLFFLAFSVSVSNTYQRIVDLPNRFDRERIHIQIIHKEGFSPLRYRLLYPYLTELLIRSNLNIDILNVNERLDPSFPMPAKNTREFKFIQIWYLLDTVSIFLTFLFTYIFLKNYSIVYRLLGCFFLFTALNAVLIGHAYQPWSLIEGFLFPIGYILMDKIKSINNKVYILLYFLTVFIASINRETGIFLVVFFLATIFIKKQVRELGLVGAGLAIISVGTLLFIRVYQGFAPQIHSISELYYMNIAGSNTNLARFELGNMFSVFWIFILIGFFMYEKKFLNYQILILIFLPFYLVFGLWGEPRILIPLFPIFIHYILRTLFLLEKKLRNVHI